MLMWFLIRYSVGDLLVFMVVQNSIVKRSLGLFSNTLANLTHYHGSILVILMRFLQLMRKVGGMIDLFAKYWTSRRW